MGRDRGRGVVCVGSVEDNAMVFIIVFGLSLFFLSWSDIAAPPTHTHLPSKHAHTSRHSLTYCSFWLCYMRETDR